MAPRQEKGIIDYTFGSGDKGWRALIEPRIVLIGVVTILLFISLFYQALHRSTISFKLRVSPAAKARLLDNGQLLTFYDGYFRNLTTTPLDLDIKAALENNESITIKGPDFLTLKPSNP